MRVPYWFFTVITFFLGLFYASSNAQDPAPLEQDTMEVREVTGHDKVKTEWADSYASDGTCYCDTNFDHGIAEQVVWRTPSLGWRYTVAALCEILPPGPGKDGNPIYNDVQCGNGPASTAEDDQPNVCPGRVDHGVEGCGHVGPLWDFTVFDCERDVFGSRLSLSGTWMGPTARDCETKQCVPTGLLRGLYRASGWKPVPCS